MKNYEMVSMITQKTGESEPLSIDCFVKTFADAQDAINTATDELSAGQSLTVWTKTVDEETQSALNPADMFSLMMETTLSDTWEENGWVMQFAAQRR